MAIPAISNEFHKASYRNYAPHAESPPSPSICSPGAATRSSSCLIDSHRYGSKAFEPLKLASDSPELIDRLDVLPMEHVPGKLR